MDKEYAVKTVRAPIFMNRPDSIYAHDPSIEQLVYAYYTQGCNKTEEEADVLTDAYLNNLINILTKER